MIFNKSIDDGVFFDFMKYSKVILLFKSGEIIEFNNYRFVFILLVFSKVFEKLILFQMFYYFNKNFIFYYQQYGFIKGCCIIDVGVILMKEIFGVWEEVQDVIGVFCDFLKVFDCVDYEIFLLKLNYYGIRNIVFCLLKLYLGDRQLKVYINGVNL